MYINVYIYIYLEPTWKSILEDLTHKMEGQPPKKEVSWVLGIYIYIIMSATGYVINLWNHVDLPWRPGAFHVAKAVLLAGSTVGVELCLCWTCVGVLLRQSLGGSLKDWDLWPLEVENRNLSVFFKVGFWRCKNLQGWFSWGNRRHRRLVTFSRSKLWLIRWNEWNGCEAVHVEIPGLLYVRKWLHFK